MKKFLVYLFTPLLFFAQISSSHAWSGGPFGLGSSMESPGATWQGTISGKGVLGFCLFGWSPTTSQVGPASVYFKGIAYIGTVFGGVDGPSRNITGIITAGRAVSLGIKQEVNQEGDEVELSEFSVLSCDGAFSLKASSYSNGPVRQAEGNCFLSFYSGVDENGNVVSSSKEVKAKMRAVQTAYEVAFDQPSLSFLLLFEQSSG